MVQALARGELDAAFVWGRRPATSRGRAAPLRVQRAAAAARPAIRSPSSSRSPWACGAATGAARPARRLLARRQRRHRRILAEYGVPHGWRPRHESAAALLLLAAAGARRLRARGARFSRAGQQRNPARRARGSAQPAGVALGGGVQEAASEHSSPYDENAYAVNQGKRLYRWYNCNGCHANGGGGIGPALMDAEWRYGSDPAQHLRQHRAGPAQRHALLRRPHPRRPGLADRRLRALDERRLRKDVAPSRADGMYPGKPENARDSPPRPEPPADKPTGKTQP
jgi:cytochrome c oxidase cbb3-type subunit 3